MKSTAAPLSYRKAEELACRRRNDEAFKREQWRDATQYFQAWERVGSRWDAWTCSSYYDHVENLNKNLQKESEHQQKLNERRERLTHLLLKEKIQYQVEMKELSAKRSSSRYTPDSSSVYEIPTESLEKVNIELYRRHQENLRRQAELKQHLAWKANQPALMEFTRKLNNNFVQRSWIDQVLDKQRQRDQEEREKAAEELERLRQIKAEQEKERQEKEIKHQEMLQLKQELMKQMELLRLEQEKCDRLKLEEERECQLQREVDELLAQREVEQKKRRNREYGLFLTKQYNLKLKQEARQVIEDMKQDQRLLAEFQSRLLGESCIDDELKRDTRKEMDTANAILSQLLERERARAKEMDFVFQDDARRLWEKQEAKWNAEQEARSRLLQEVFATIRAQIAAKLESNLIAQRDLLAEREQLLRNVEEAHASVEAKQREIEAKTQQWTSEVEAQVLEKEMRKKEEELKAAQERDREIQAAAEEERKLADELEKLRTTAFVPQYRPRRRVLW